MDFVCSFLNRMVLPCCRDREDGMSAVCPGVYAIELHDGYTYRARDCCTTSPSSAYMENTKDEERNDALLLDSVERAYDNVMVFSRRRTDVHPTLIPDPHQMSNYGGIADKRDATPWEKKKPAMFFAGTTTGHKDPLKNARVRACAWSMSRRNIAHFYLTRAAPGTDARALVASYPHLPGFGETVLHAPFAPDTHHGYRVALNVPGNTCSWSRVPAILNSRTLLFDVRQPDMSWWYPALVEGTHYVGVDLPDDENGTAGSSPNPLVDKFRRAISDGKRAASMCDAANEVAALFTRSIHAAEYMKHLLEASAWFHSP